jgi:predicted NAD-dependent protein-ADP-ribosyltransferase YbiA (DUF1768 family)
MTYGTRWGSDEVTVTADWAQAACPVDGDAHGRQVAHFGHDGWAALRAAVEDCASFDGLTSDESDALIEAAMAKAKARKAEVAE